MMAEFEALAATIAILPNSIKRATITALGRVVKVAFESPAGAIDELAIVERHLGAIEWHRLRQKLGRG